MLRRASRPGVRHAVNRVWSTFTVGLFHLPKHGFRNFLGNIRPYGDDLVITFSVGYGSLLVLLFNFDNVFARVGNKSFLVHRNGHVVNADRKTRQRCIGKAKIFERIERLDGRAITETQVAVVDHLTETTLLEQAVDKRKLLWQRKIEKNSSNRGLNDLLGALGHFSMDHVLVVW